LTQGIRAIKFYNWEVPFLGEAGEIQKKTDESRVSLFRRFAKLNWALLTAATSATPAIVSTVTLLLYSYWTKELLQPSKIFTALSLFNQIRLPLLFYPWVLSALADGKVSLGRLDTFLKAPEVESYVERGDPGRRLPAGTAISLEDAAFAWNPNGTATCSGEARPCRPPCCPPEHSFPYGHTAGRGGNLARASPPTLRGLNLRAREGELVAVVGLVGSGKSSVISALMGEMHRVCGSVMVKGASPRAADAVDPATAPSATTSAGRPHDEGEYGGDRGLQPGEGHRPAAGRRPDGDRGAGHQPLGRPEAAAVHRPGTLQQGRRVPHGRPAVCSGRGGGEGCVPARGGGRPGRCGGPARAGHQPAAVPGPGRPGVVVVGEAPAARHPHHRRPGGTTCELRKKGGGAARRDEAGQTRAAGQRREAPPRSVPCSFPSFFGHPKRSAWTARPRPLCSAWTPPSL
ncbi:unnamed protein product, partial [Heterosigma akashiwo]